MAANFISSFLPGYSSPGSTNSPNEQDIEKEGYLIKQKNMKKKYFVLRKDGPSRLEYYETRKKFLDRTQPRKKYELSKCYTISKVDSKNNGHAFALFVNAECVTLIADSKESMQDWVQKLMQQKHAAGNAKVEHEHVWYVDIIQRSLAASNSLGGPHLVCLNNCSLTLVGSDNEYRIKTEFKFNTIRQCGHLKEFFFIELGRYSSINSGVLWMKAEDAFIATNMHNIVDSAMNQSCPEGCGGRNQVDQPRKRTPSVCTPRRDSELAPATRHRADSTPSRHTTSETLCPHQTLHDCLFEMNAIENNSRQTPDRDANSGDNVYVKMTPSDTGNVIGDLQREFAPAARRRADSTPSRRTTSETHCPHQAFHDCLFEMNASENNPCQTPDRDANSGDKDNEYVTMTPSDPGNVIGDSQRGLSECNFVHPIDLSDEDRSEYISPTSFSGFHHYSHSTAGVSSDLGSPSGCSSCNPHVMSTPVSPIGLASNNCWRSFPPPHNQLPSPQASSGSHSAAHSRTSSLLNENFEDYVPIQPGVTSFPAELTTNSDTSPSVSLSNPYLEMGPGPGVLIDTTSRLSSNPTPIPISSREDAYHEISINSGNSSITSGTDSSDHPLNGMGTPSSTGSTLGQTFGIADADDPQMRPLRTNSIGSKPEHYKRKNSAPMLVGSPVSHSWSGTPGCHFRNIGHKDSPHDGNHLLLDYSGNKSFDNITEVKDKKSFWPFTSHRRQHSISKSNDNPNLSSREKKLSEGESTHRPIDIPISTHTDYCQMNFTGNSPRSTSHDLSSGYLPMHAPLSVSSTALRITPSLHDQPWDMSSSLSSCGSQDGYVDMTQGSSPGSLIVASSSSSSTSLNVHATRSRRTGNIINPITSADLPSPLEEDMTCDLELMSEVDSNKKKGRKSSKKRSIRGSARKKKSDPCGTEGETESSKNKSPFSSFSNLLNKKSSSIKFPLSPQGNGKLNPFSGLSSGKGKEAKETSSSPPLSGDSNCKVEVEEKCAMQPANASSSIAANTSHAISNPTNVEKIAETIKSKSVLEISTSSLSPRVPFSDKRSSLCEMVSKALKIDESVNYTSSTPNIKSPSCQTEQEGNYVNMIPSTSNVLQSNVSIEDKSSKSPQKLISPTLSLKIQKTFDAKTDNICPRSSSDDSVPFPRLEPKSSTDLDILTGPEQSHIAIIERSRSHSGPGAPSTSAKTEKGGGQGNGRAASACSSPISSSPPTSPTLGSVSSMSSLSEGGLSSASSTCTVVNVGTSRIPSQHISSSNSSAQHKLGKSSYVPEQVNTSTLLDKDCPSPAQASPSKCQASALALDSLNPSNSNQQSSGDSKNSLNYASLDLGTCVASESSPRSKRESSNNADDSSLGYVQIDFTKSEGLRNTSLARDSSRY